MIPRPHANCFHSEIRDEGVSEFGISRMFALVKCRGLARMSVLSIVDSDRKEVISEGWVEK